MYVCGRIPRVCFKLIITHARILLSALDEVTFPEGDIYLFIAKGREREKKRDRWCVFALKEVTRVNRIGAACCPHLSSPFVAYTPRPVRNRIPCAQSVFGQSRKHRGGHFDARKGPTQKSLARNEFVRSLSRLHPFSRLSSLYIVTIHRSV